LDRQRIDKWLWHARLVRTRAAAAELAASGLVRINGGRIDAPGRAVKLGDVLTIALDRAVRVLKVAGFAERRGPARATGGLYEDLAPLGRPSPDRVEPQSPARDPGAGRPTKRERRAIDRFAASGED
jgi:ribosome-associated heat shock protein Hsp15